MQITKEADYAIRCILYLASREGETITVGAIAGSQGAPKMFTAKILQKLKKAGVLDSTRGVKGGFMLAYKPSEISLLDVIETIQGPVSFNRCVIDHTGCSRSDTCPVHPVWRDLTESFKTQLRNISFAFLLERSAGHISIRYI